MEEVIRLPSTQPRRNQLPGLNRCCAAGLHLRMAVNIVVVLLQQP
jgi:hypothetical protein